MLEKQKVFNENHIYFMPCKSQIKKVTTEMAMIYFIFEHIQIMNT